MLPYLCEGCLDGAEERRLRRRRIQIHSHLAQQRGEDLVKVGVDGGSEGCYGCDQGKRLRPQQLRKEFGCQMELCIATASEQTSKQATKRAGILPCFSEHQPPASS